MRRCNDVLHSIALMFLLWGGLSALIVMPFVMTSQASTVAPADIQPIVGALTPESNHANVILQDAHRAHPVGAGKREVTTGEGAGSDAASSRSPDQQEGPGIAIVKAPETQQVRYGGTVTFSIAVTNTGDVTLTGVTVTDAVAPNCARSLGSLSAGVPASYTCTSASALADFTNVATATGRPPVGSNVTAMGSASVDVISPGLVMAKMPDVQQIRSGGSATFGIVVTNTGDVNLADVAVNDAQAPNCQFYISTLSPGAYAQHSCARDNALADFTNVATATAQPPVGPDLSVSDDALVDVTNPSITIRKLPTTQQVRHSGTVTFSIRITNTGDVTLSNVSVTDGQAPDCGRSLGTLTSGAGTGYICSRNGVTADFTNTAVVTGTPPVGADVSAVDAATVDLIGPAIQIAKTPHAQLVRRSGTVTFSIAVTNTGDVTLNGVTVSDVQALDCAHSLGTLAPGAHASYACARANVLVDFTNVASATGGPPVGAKVTADDHAAVEVINPSMKIDIAPDSQQVRKGNPVTFTIVVTNTGDVALSTVTVTDVQVPDCVRSLGALDVAMRTRYTCANPDALSDDVNYVSVSALAPDGGDVTASDSAVVDVIDPSLSLVKVTDSGAVRSGSTVTFTTSVTNTGDTSLRDVSVTDALCPTCAQAIGDMDAGLSISYACVLTDTTADLINRAVVTGTPPLGPAVTGIGTATVRVLHAPFFASVPITRAVQGVPYTYTVTAADLDAGDVLTITVPVRPAWLDLTIVGSGEAVLSGTASISGTYPVGLMVSDTLGLTGTQSFTIGVQPPLASGQCEVYISVVEAAGLTTRLFVTSDNTGVIRRVEIWRASDDTLVHTCENIPNGAVQYPCGEFPPGQYWTVAFTERCGTLQAERTWAPGSVTIRVYRN